jgi:outer membrane protein TolC
MPVDLDQHLRDVHLRTPPTDLVAGISRSDARELAKMFHPDARLARRRAGVAEAQRDHAGAWADPFLQTQLQRILDTVPYEWVAQMQLGFSVPINGRLQKQRELADRRNDEALLSAWTTEQRVANDVDKAWVDWTSARQRGVLFAQTCSNLKQLAELAQALVDTGGLSRPGARVFTLEHRQQEAQRTMALANEQAAYLEVLRRTGLHPDALITLQEDLSVRPFLANAQARRESLPSSPRLIAQQFKHLTAEANLHLQIRKQWPDLQLGPIWQEEDAQPRPGIGLNLPLPIFTGNDPAIAQATAQRELTAEALRAALEQLLQELAIAEVRHAASAQQATTFRKLIASTTQQIEDSRNLASAGQLDPMLMLDALLRAHKVQMQTIDADATAAHATITINTLLTDPRSQAPAMSTGDNR